MVVNLLEGTAETCGIDCNALVKTNDIGRCLNELVLAGR